MECALINKKTNFVDDGSDIEKENAADKFARNRLISETDYQIFVAERNYGIESIKRFAASQNVMPYIVIGRLQKEKNLITVCLVITNYDINGQNNENVEKRVVRLELHEGDKFQIKKYRAGREGSEVCRTDRISGQ